jgi:hypothetical protein
MVIALSCAAGCCDTFCVNELAAAADAHAKPLDTVDRFSSWSKQLCEALRIPQSQSWTTDSPAAAAAALTSAQPIP